ncbi:SRPBCC family protein [Muricauda sp. 334s03]|uniref:SRPBCC family protein n=1 Tax=Flagellimonas yonaguniensis TaxID=3031325 RepID=A0ABT5XW67_9FLAO|nr:SRPBCC family protein [[Muricauda] yonaguniensis]MDF0715433.1 SRPBCC family protein [[Muricauda] yonaguniensis]
MKYTTEIVVDVPREEFIKKMDDPDNMKHWQRGLIAYEQLSNNPGQEGARMSLSYEMGKRKMDMVETIIKRNLPKEIHMTYDTKGVHNIQKNFFKEEDGKTRWISESEFQLSGFGMKLMGFLMPGAFKKQSLKYMEDFKAFAENGISVLNS